jgi:hypothetical protein
MLNTGLTAVFTVELLVNMFAHWFADFASNSWYHGMCIALQSLLHSSSTCPPTCI